MMMMETRCRVGGFHVEGTRLRKGDILSKREDERERRMWRTDCRVRVYAQYWYGVCYLSLDSITKFDWRSSHSVTAIELNCCFRNEVLSLII